MNKGKDMSRAGDPAGVRQFTDASDDDGIRLDRWFKRHMPDASFAIVSRWARTGQLRVDGARATPGDRITEGQVLRVPPLEPVATSAKTARPRPVLTEDQITFAEALVIHRDAQALVINKPPGLATTGWTRTRAAHCCWRVPPAVPRTSPRAFPPARRARSIGRS